MKTALCAWVYFCLAAGFALAGEVPENTARSAAGAWSDWPQFLGPDRNGSSPEKGLLRQWPEGGPKELWRVKLGKSYGEGRGYGTPCVYRGEVYLSGSGQMISLDAFTGKEQWRTNLTRLAPQGMARRDAWGNCPKGTVTATEKRLYASDSVGQFYCLDRATGKEVWTRDLWGDYLGAWNGENHGWAASPVLSDGVVVMSASRPFVTTPGAKLAIVGLDAETGKTVWEYPHDTKRSPCTYTTPALVRIRGDACALFAFGSPNVYLALRVRDGRPVYESPFTGFASEASLQVIDGTRILRTPFPHDSSSAPCVRLDKVDFTQEKFEGGEAWVKNDLKGSYSTWLAYEGYLYGFAQAGPRFKEDHLLVCLEASTGKEMWRQKIDQGQHSITLADGLLFVRFGPELWLVEATPKGFSLKGKVDPKIREAWGWFASNSGWVMPALAYGRLYLRSETELICLQAAEVLPTADDVLGR